MSSINNFQPPNLFTPVGEVPGEQEERLKNPDPALATADNTKPGVLPGAFPAVEEPVNQTAGGQGIAQSAYQTGQAALQSVGATVKPYLPVSVASYLPATSTGQETGAQAQQSVETRPPQAESNLTSNVTSSLTKPTTGPITSWPTELIEKSKSSTTLEPTAPFLPPPSNPVLEDAAHVAGNTVTTVKSTASPVVSTLSAKAGDAARFVQQSAVTVGSSIVGMAPESIAQYLPGRDTGIPTGTEQQSQSTNIAATTTIPPLTKPSNANTHTAAIAGSTDIPPLTKPSSSIVEPAEVAAVSAIEPLSKPFDAALPKPFDSTLPKPFDSTPLKPFNTTTGTHTHIPLHQHGNRPTSTAIAPKKSTAVAPARIDLDSRPSQVAMTTGIEPLDKEPVEVVEATEVAGEAGIAPLEKGTTGLEGATENSSAMTRAANAALEKRADAARHVKEAAMRVEGTAKSALPVHRGDNGGATTHAESGTAATPTTKATPTTEPTTTSTTTHTSTTDTTPAPRSRSPIKGDQTTHPKSTTGDNLHAPATTNMTDISGGIPHRRTVVHTREEPVQGVLERHGEKNAGVKSGAKDTEEHGGNEGEGKGEGKIGVKDKVKGEMKVIAGKIAGNEGKVEEGKRMMGKMQN